MLNLLNQLIAAAGASPPWSYLVLLIPIAAIAVVGFLIWKLSGQSRLITILAVAALFLTFGGFSLEALGIKVGEISARPGEPINIVLFPGQDPNHAPGMDMPRSRLAGMESFGLRTEALANAGAGLRDLPDPWGYLPPAGGQVVTTTIAITGTGIITGPPSTMVVSSTLPFSGTHPATPILMDWVEQGQSAARELQARRETLGADIGAPATYLYIWSLDLQARVWQEPPAISTGVPITGLVEATEALVAPYRMIQPSHIPASPSTEEFETLVDQLSAARFLSNGDYLDLDARMAGLSYGEIEEEANRQMDRLTPTLTAASLLKHEATNINGALETGYDADAFNNLKGIIADFQALRLNLKAVITAAASP